MRQLPVRAQVLISSAAVLALSILAFALVETALGVQGGTVRASSADAQRTMLELLLIFVVTGVSRSLLLAGGAGVTRKGLISTAAILVGTVTLFVYWTVGSAGRSAINPIVFLVVLAIVTSVAASSATLSIGGGGVSVDQALPVLMAATLITGTWGGVIVAASQVLVPPHGSEWVKSVFNNAVRVISVWAAGTVFTLLTSHYYVHDAANGSSATLLDSWLRSGSTFTPGSVFALVGAVLLANLMFVVANATLIGAIVSITGNSAFVATMFELVRSIGGPFALNSVLGLMLAIVYLHSGVGALAMILVMLPLFAARWVFSQIAGERAAQEATLAALIKAVETKDWYTKGHSERVAVAALEIGGSLKLDPDLMRELRFAGMLHDVGKLGVPTGVLIKPGRLDDAEFEAIKRHPVLGQEVVRGIEFLEEAKRGIYYHHERIDGRGYPEGLKGEEIPLFARILGVADAFDSMTQVRSYRGARSIEAALVELNAHRDTQFDSRMVDALITALDAGWVPETPPVVEEVPTSDGVPALGVDDDDPAAAAALAAHRPPRSDAP